MIKTLVVFLAGVLISIWGVLNEIVFLKIVGLIIAIFLIGLGLLEVIGFALIQRGEAPKEAETSDTEKQK